MQATLFLPNFMLNFTKGSTSALKIYRNLLNRNQLPGEIKILQMLTVKTLEKRELLSSVFKKWVSK